MTPAVGRETARHDAIVVGAGIVGAACAAALARDGLRVLVLDADAPALGTTAAAMGHVVVMDDSPEQLAITSYSARLWREQSDAVRAVAELDWCGTIWVAEDDSQLAVVREKQRVYAEHRVDAELLDAHALADAEPNLRGGLAGGLLVRGDGVLYPPAAAVALLDVARAHGAVVHAGWLVERIVPGGVWCNGSLRSAGVIVNAAGPGAPALTPGLPIVPRKGHLVITDRYPGFCRHQLVELGYLASAHEMTGESVAFNVQPRPTGQVLVGSSRELVGWDRTINRRVLARMLARAVDFLPRLGGLAAIRTWTGFRPATPDALPLIGAWRETPGLWIAAGHEGLGITSSLGTAAVLADLVAGRPPAIDPAPYDPARATPAEARG